MEIPAGKNNVHLIPVCQLDQDVQVIAGHGQVYAIGDVIRNPVRGGSVVQDDYFSRLYQTGCILCNAAFLFVHGTACPCQAVNVFNIFVKAVWRVPAQNRLSVRTFNDTFCLKFI